MNKIDAGNQKQVQINHFTLQAIQHWEQAKVTLDLNGLYDTSIHNLSNSLPIRYYRCGSRNLRDGIMGGGLTAVVDFRHRDFWEGDGDRYNRNV